jgi:hypothetical protein
MFWKKFTPLEERVLSRVRSSLSPEAREIFDAQVDAINLVQRQLDWSEILFYRRRKGKIDWSEVSLFGRSDNYRLAKVDFAIGRVHHQATVNCISGHIFSLTFSPAAKPIAFKNWDDDGIVELLSDPMVAVDSDSVETLPPSWITLLKDLSPNDYPNWNIYDAHSARRITIGGQDLLLLAERSDDQFVVCRPDSRDGIVYKMGHESDPEPISMPLMEFFG